jgi:putrescine aminotransferase
MKLETFNTADLVARDAAHHLHSQTDPAAILGEGSRVIVRGEGCHVWDSDGRKILDGMAGLWCVNIGYGRTELADVAAEQMRVLPYYNNHFQSAAPPMIALGEKLASLTPEGLDHFAYGCSGSEANDAIVRLVRHYWRRLGKPDKRVFISRTLAYHGSTVAAASLGGMPAMHAMDGVLAEVAHIEHPHWYVNGGDLTPEEYGLKAARALAEKIEELGSENVAAFIAEPVQGAGAVIVPPETYWPEIQRICRQYDILLIADEVICGFGRTGNWFGSQTFGIAPDFMPMAKGISSGYLPVSAVAIHDRVFDVLATGGYLPHGYTYSGHPTACAVAIANIEIMERENLPGRVRDDIGPYFQAAMQTIADTHPLVGERRGVGMMAALQLVRNKATREVCTMEDNAAILTRDAAYADGLIARAIGQSMVLSPPLIATHAEVDEMAAILARSLDGTAVRLGVS